MSEDWYTITGGIDSNVAQNLMTYVNGRIYNSDIKKIRVLISSTGGDVDSAIRIYSYLKALPFEVETIALSQIDSAANIIYVAGQQRIAIKGCRFFLHEGTFTTGAQTTTLHNHEEALLIFKELLKKHINILAKETSKKEEDINKLLQTSTIMDAEKAKEFGFVHEILEKLPFKKQV
ncbi:MAG: ATP-dependent Clp protease proteolytic subunit [Patescibacteria group bacterium]|nr:ATP-dependent Clp protease proteolytic subunit [Patescibacteria group bacterium]MDE1945990.1 ATP-dependent Clp protease proteolytic subunit [Patescibacteria group bacterium]